MKDNTNQNREKAKARVARKASENKNAMQGTGDKAGLELYILTYNTNFFLYEKNRVQIRVCDRLCV